MQKSYNRISKFDQEKYYRKRGLPKCVEEEKFLHKMKLEK